MANVHDTLRKHATGRAVEMVVARNRIAQAKAALKAAQEEAAATLLFGCPIRPGMVIAAYGKRAVITHVYPKFRGLEYEAVVLEKDGSWGVPLADTWGPDWRNAKLVPDTTMPIPEEYRR